MEFGQGEGEGCADGGGAGWVEEGQESGDGEGGQENGDGDEDGDEQQAVEPEENEEPPEESPQEDEEEDRADSGAAGSAEEATKDKAVVPVVRETAVPIVPRRTDSLDVVTASAASSGGGGAGGPQRSAEPTLVVLFLKLEKHPICMVGNNEETLRVEILKNYPVPANTTEQAYFKATFAIRKLPLDWKQTLEQNKLKPVSTSLMGKPEVLLWPAAGK